MPKGWRSKATKRARTGKPLMYKPQPMDPLMLENPRKWLLKMAMQKQEDERRYRKTMEEITREAVERSLIYGYAVIHSDDLIQDELPSLEEQPLALPSIDEPGND